MAHTSSYNFPTLLTIDPNAFRTSKATLYLFYMDTVDTAWVPGFPISETKTNGEIPEDF